MQLAMRCVLPSVRDRLRERVDEAREHYDRFCISASREDMELLVGAWTRMLLAMADVDPWLGGPRTERDRLSGSSEAATKEVATVLGRN